MSRMNIVIGQVMKRHKMRPELVKVRYLRLVLDKYLLKVRNLVNSFFKDIFCDSTLHACVLGSFSV